MEGLIPEILAIIAEFADIQSIYNLMLTCKRFHEVLLSNERSVVKRRLDAYYRSAIDPRVFQHPELVKDHPLIRLSEKKYGAVLTSDSPRRTVARPYSYAVIKELEVRERRINERFSFTQANISRSGLVGAGLSPETREHLDSLARACRVADIIGDCVARIVARADFVQGYNAHLTEAHYARLPSTCPCNSWGYALLGYLSEDILNARGRRMLERSGPLLPGSRAVDRDVETMVIKLVCTVRKAQLALIQGLSQWDLVYLSWLTEVAGDAYTGMVPEDLPLTDTSHWERRTAFKECVIRRGASLTIWAVCADDETRELDSNGVWSAFPPVENKKMAQLMDVFDKEVEVKEEVKAGGEEDGTIPVMEPGLQMTTVGTMRRKANPDLLQKHERDFVKLMTRFEDAEEKSDEDWDGSMDD
ncbi:hypothetical protein NKR19_g4079 [Coniochaeta hoffmannii]|uniref:F-box domain-containing protein n=1 Tax=Coniochaeta hoffmannii TaxID=91930 RepID=A0AA38RRL6_9PEZI|nr:hypothetical protein NKR19_g4079 [Coniochaeta hoffmannii]